MISARFLKQLTTMCALLAVLENFKYSMQKATPNFHFVEKETLISIAVKVATYNFVYRFHFVQCLNIKAQQPQARLFQIEV